MFVRCLLAALALIVLSRPAWATPHALLLWAPQDNVPHCSFYDDSMLLLVIDGNEELARYEYCSAYGRGSAQVVVDERDHRRLYVIINYSIGRGTSVTADWAKVMIIDDDAATLHEVAHVLLRGYDAPTSRWFYDYDVLADAHGGIVLRLDYAPGPEAECCAPPEKHVSIRIAE